MSRSWNTTDSPKSWDNNLRLDISGSPPRSMQVNTYMTWTNWYNVFYEDNENIFMLNICWINEKVQIVKNLSETSFYKVLKVPPDSTTH